MKLSYPTWLYTNPKELAQQRYRLCDCIITILLFTCRAVVDYKIHVVDKLSHNYSLTGAYAPRSLRLTSSLKNIIQSS